MVALTGLEALITPVVEDCDKHVEEVLASQASLSANIDRLTRGSIIHPHTRTRCTSAALAQGPRATAGVFWFSGGGEEPPGGPWPHLSRGGSLAEKEGECAGGASLAQAAKPPASV